MIYEEGALNLFISPALKEKIKDIENRGGSFNNSMKNAFKKWCNGNIKQGNTTLHEPGLVIPDGIDTKQYLHSYSNLIDSVDCRVSASLMYDNAVSLSIKGTIELYRTYKTHSSKGKELVLHGIKIVADGSNQAMTGYQTKPYIIPSNGEYTCGRPNYDSYVALTKMVENISARKQPVLIHCNGDRALHDSISAINDYYYPQSLQSKHKLNPHGVNRIEHCTITSSVKQIFQMKELEIQPSFLMNHVYYYGLTYRRELLGEARTLRMDPARDCVDHDLNFSLHSDAPCSNVGALQMIHTAVTRQYEENGKPSGKSTSYSQAVSPYDALRAVTITAAQHIGQEKNIGSLDKGKFADFVILDNNPLITGDILNIKVLETWVGGEMVYKFTA